MNWWIVAYGCVLVLVAYVFGYLVGMRCVSEVAERDWRRLNWMQNYIPEIDYDQFDPDGRWGLTWYKYGDYEVRANSLRSCVDKAMDVPVAWTRRCVDTSKQLDPSLLLLKYNERRKRQGSDDDSNTDA